MLLERVTWASTVSPLTAIQAIPVPWRRKIRVSGYATRAKLRHPVATELASAGRVWRSSRAQAKQSAVIKPPAASNVGIYPTFWMPNP